MSTANRTYSQPPDPSKGSPAFLYCWNPNTIWSGGGGEAHTGTWVTLQLDSNGFLQTSVNNVVFSGTVNYGFTTLLTGNSITYLTGNPNVTVSNALLATSGNTTLINPLLAISGNATIVNSLLATSGNTTIINSILPISGVVQSNVTNPILSVSGNVISSGTFSPTFSGTTSGQIQIPIGARTWSIAIESGTATYVNGALFTTTRTLQGGNYNGQQTLSSVINVGTTGGRVVAYWE